ncbi:MAG: 4-hydroxy-tetrahydrodipicolinate synthase [Acidobacteria bacterium]|nr:MAG: 4-hydroxy-tetrahydrodipicolinate synthase [Acidobacteriota bacterium]
MMKLEPRFLRGSYPPLVTPFRHGAVDHEALARLVARQVHEGSHGILACGTTAEATSLSTAERNDVVRTAVRAAAGRVPVVAGAGAASYEESVALVEGAERAGADAVLVVTPFYVKPPQAGLVEYFAAVGQRTKLPLLIYHIPGRAAVAVTAETVARIADRLPSLVGIKHAAPDVDLVTELRLRLGPEFRTFAGLETLSLPMLAVGAVGVMSAVGNLVPARVAAMCRAVAEGALADAQRLHLELFELSQAIFLDTNPIALKYMMSRLGLLDGAEVRLPLVGLDAERQARADKVLERAGLLGAAAAAKGVA